MLLDVRKAEFLFTHIFSRKCWKQTQTPGERTVCCVGLQDRPDIWSSCLRWWSWLSLLVISLLWVRLGPRHAVSPVGISIYIYLYSVQTRKCLLCDGTVTVGKTAEQHTPILSPKYEDISPNPSCTAKSRLQSHCYSCCERSINVKWTCQYGVLKLFHI